MMVEATPIDRARFIPVRFSLKRPEDYDDLALEINLRSTLFRVTEHPYRLKMALYHTPDAMVYLFEASLIGRGELEVRDPDADEKLMLREMGVVA